MIGAIALGFVVFQIARMRGWFVPSRPAPSRPAGLFWGTIAGFTSFVSHAGGPPAAIYLLGSRLDKTRFQATTVVVFWWVNLIKFPAYIALGMFTPATLWANLILAPVAILGVLLGAWAHNLCARALVLSARPTGCWW